MEVSRGESPSILRNPWNMSWRRKPLMDSISKIFWGPLLPSTSFLKSFSPMTMQLPSLPHQIDSKLWLFRISQSFSRKESAKGLVLAEISKDLNFMLGSQNSSGKPSRVFLSAEGPAAATQDGPISSPGWSGEAEATHQGGSSKSEAQDVSCEDSSILTYFTTAWLPPTSFLILAVSRTESCGSSCLGNSPACVPSQ